VKRKHALLVKGFVLALAVVIAGCAVYANAKIDCKAAATKVKAACGDVAQDEATIEAECNGFNAGQSDCWRSCVEQNTTCNQFDGCQNACP
jgi:hypothetical protein